MGRQVKAGLGVGCVGLLLNIGVAFVLGFCGPFATLIAGAIAGYLAVYRAPLASKGDGARAGALAGGITGALMLVGQSIGALTTLVFFQATGNAPPFGQLPRTSVEQVGFYLGGLGFGVCLGLVGVLLGALAGAGAGYLAAPPEQPASDLSGL